MRRTRPPRASAAAGARCADRSRRLAGGGARCSTASARPARRAERRAAGRGRRPADVAPSARSSRSARRARASARARASGRASSRATRRPTSPQPTISSVGRLKRVGGRSSRRRPSACGQNRGLSLRARTRCLACPMTFTVTVQPSGRTFSVDRDEPILAAAIRQGVGLPYGCHDGACGSCKCRMLEGRVIHGAHQPKALSRRGGSRRPASSPARPRRRPTCVARGAHRARRRRVRDPQDADAGHRDRRSPRPTSRSCSCSCRRTTRCSTTPASTSSSSCATARAAATRWRTRRTRRSTSPAIELHLRHLPGGKFTDHVFGAMKEKEILRMEGPFGSFFLREDCDKPMVLLASGTGFAPIKAIIEHLQLKDSQRQAVLYWGCRSARRPVPARLGARRRRATAEPALRARCSPSRSRKTTGPAAPASSTSAVMHDLPEPDRTTRSTPAARRSWSSRRSATSSPQCGLPDDEFYADSFTSEADKHGG